MTTRITVIGSEPAWPSANRACSGYLVQTAASTVLIDCGTGVFARLRALLPPEELTAIVISHLHFDHWADLIPFRYYTSYEAQPESPPQLHVPPGGIARLQGITEAFDRDTDFLAGTFRMSEYDPEGELTIGDLRITFELMRHPIETYALRIVTADGVICYSADTGWEPRLAQHAQGSDLFICEANWGADESGGPMHLTAAEAARLATMAGAKQLLLTHLPERTASDAVQAAKNEFAGEVEHATAGRAVDIGQIT